MNQTLTVCPICNSSNQTVFGHAVDYTVSKSEFQLVECKNCNFVFTNPRPDQNSIGAYYESDEYVSHSNTNKGLIFTLYQVVRKITLKQKTKFVTSLTQGRNALDVGSGTGDFLASLKADQWNAVGLEPNENARLQSISNHLLEVYHPSALFDGFKDKSFDLITMWHVLEHVHDLKAYVAKISDLLNTNGVAVIAVPNRSSLDAKIYGFHWAAWDVPRHLYHFRAEDIIRLFAEFGLTHEQTKIMPYDGFYVSLLSEKYKHKKYRYVPAFISGLRSLLNALITKNTASSQIYVFRKK